METKATDERSGSEDKSESEEEVSEDIGDAGQGYQKQVVEDMSSIKAKLDLLLESLGIASLNSEEVAAGDNSRFNRHNSIRGSHHHSFARQASFVGLQPN